MFDRDGKAWLDGQSVGIDIVYTPAYGRLVPLARYQTSMILNAIIIPQSRQSQRQCGVSDFRGCL